MNIKAEPGKNVVWISVRMATNSSGDFFGLETADNVYNGVDLNLILLENPSSGHNSGTNQYDDIYPISLRRK